MENKSYAVSHSFKNETLQGKLEINLSKTPEERYFSMLDLYDFLIEANPDIIKWHDSYTESTHKSIQILKQT